MPSKSPVAALVDIIAAIDHTEAKLSHTTLQAFQGDLDSRRIVERNFEIISEASRRLPDELKDAHPEIPWDKVAGIGNILRHDYENVVPDMLWTITHNDLPDLKKACRIELIEQRAREQERNSDPSRDRSGHSR